jgi:hypothetical protein
MSTWQPRPAAPGPYSGPPLLAVNFLRVTYTADKFPAGMIQYESRGQFTGLKVRTAGQAQPPPHRPFPDPEPRGGQPHMRGRQLPGLPLLAKPLDSRPPATHGWFMPTPGLRWGSVWLAPEPIAGRPVGAGLQIRIEHARVGGSVGEDAGRGVHAGLA